MADGSSEAATGVLHFTPIHTTTPLTHLTIPLALSMPQGSLHAIVTNASSWRGTDPSAIEKEAMANMSRGRSPGSKIGTPGTGGAVGGGGSRGRTPAMLGSRGRTVGSRQAAPTPGDRLTPLRAASPTADGGAGGSNVAAGPSAASEAAAVPDEYICPITAEIMTDPVTTQDGFTYERAAITEWLRTKDTSPKTGATLESKALIPIHSLRSMIRAFTEAGSVPSTASP